MCKILSTAISASIASPSFRNEISVDEQIQRKDYHLGFA